MPGRSPALVYISYRDNSRLDPLGFAGFGRVIGGLSATVDAFCFGYGEGGQGGTGPNQQAITAKGNAYLIRQFPKLDHVVTTRITEEWRR